MRLLILLCMRYSSQSWNQLYYLLWDYLPCVDTSYFTFYKITFPVLTPVILPSMKLPSLCWTPVILLSMRFISLCWQQLYYLPWDYLHCADTSYITFYEITFPVLTPTIAPTMNLPSLSQAIYITYYEITFSVPTTILLSTTTLPSLCQHQLYDRLSNYLSCPITNYITYYESIFSIPSPTI